MNQNEIEDSKVLIILRAAIKTTLRNIKMGTAVGSDQIPVGTLKCMNEDALDILLQLFNEVTKRGHMPKQGCSPLSTLSQIAQTLLKLS